ncbi:hypothetical protein SAMN05216588_103141 [Pseudomonas flavescens]|uniref:Uncharacterized protein n=1 Tax=Phytopseudomonas flavescens TaxID=29435 RepID=A0A1G8AFG2_9GAMM|nr:hypothetical protein SAMN05216588_103141 [Pseudomonas flavescens]
MPAPMARQIAAKHDLRGHMLAWDPFSLLGCDLNGSQGDHERFES